MDVITRENFRAADRFLASASVQAVVQIHTLGHDNTRALMRSFASEQNRWSIEQWERVQIGTGLCLVLLLIFGSRPPKIPIGLSLLMLIVVLVFRFGLTPEITRLGRIVDFLPPGAPGSEQRSFAAMNNAYTILELAKLAMGFTMAAILLIRRRADPEMFARESELEQAAMPQARRRTAR